jgi:methylation protein EvaC
MKEMNVYSKRKECAICSNCNLDTILDYGAVTLAGFFPKSDELDNIKKYDLSLQYCRRCHLMQTNSTVDADVLFKDYRYLSSIGLQKHFNEYTEFLASRFLLDGNSKVIEFGSNDGVLLRPMMDKGVNIVGFEPSDNISKIAISRGCNVINDYFSINTVRQYCEESDYDLVTSSNCFAHIDDIHSVVKGIKYVLKNDGHFSFEVHYGKNIIEEVQYDNVYHEHIYYYTVTSLKSLFEMHSMTIVDVIEIPIHAGSIRVIVKNSEEKYNNKIVNILNDEEVLGITSVSYYENFKSNVFRHKQELYNTLMQLKNEGYSIGAYGASGRANILCNFGQLDEKIIDYIIDESPERCNRFINNIPIYSLDKIDPKSDYILVLAWNYSNMIISKLEDKYSFKYIIPFPDTRIISTTDELNYINLL